MHTFVDRTADNSFFFDPDEVDADLAPEDFVAEEQCSELVKFLALMAMPPLPRFASAQRATTDIRG